MARVAEFVLWVLIFALAAIGISAAYGVLSMVDTAPIAKTLASHCTDSASLSSCLDGVARLNRMRVSTWLTAAATALAGTGTACGFALIVLAFNSAGAARAERDRRTVLLTGLAAMGISGAVLIAALIVRSM
jgi:hypothetical protein